MTTQHKLLHFPHPTTTTATITSPRAYRVLRQGAPAASSPAPGILGQIREASRSPAGLGVGSIFGAWVPLASYWIAHHEIPAAQGVMLWCLVAFVLGGLTYSARKVYRWARLAHGDARYWAEALGFTLLTEGVMVLSSTTWLRAVALGLLIAINAIATGVTIARGK